MEDQPIDAIGFHPAFWDGTTTWTVSPSLPNSLSQDSATGEITGTVDDVMTGTYTVTATHSSGATETFSFSIDSLLDTDGDGLPDDLPSTYNPANPPTSGLIADDDDDGDGLPTALKQIPDSTSTDRILEQTHLTQILMVTEFVMVQMQCHQNVLLALTHHQMVTHRHQLWLH